MFIKFKIVVVVSESFEISIIINISFAYYSNKPRLPRVVWPNSVAFLYWVPWKLMGRMTPKDTTVVVNT